jgi:hypothetical protein
MTVQNPDFYFYYLDGIVVEADFVYMAAQLEAYDPREVTHTRTFTYWPKAQETAFGMNNLEANIVSVFAYSVLPDNKHRYVSLDRQGEVFFQRGSDGHVIVERLPGAGLRGGNLGGLMMHLREIGGKLFACGQNGQVFCRFAQDDWRHVDQGLHTPLDLNAFKGTPDALAKAMFDGAHLNCIDGNDLTDIYAVGNKGLVAHYSAGAWRTVPIKTDEHLQWVRCYGKDEVWICGFNGTLLVGNGRDGFKDVSSVDDNQTWACLTKFQNRIYLSAEEGLYSYDGKTIAPVVTGLKPELQDAWRVDHKDGVLWSIGVKDLARFDGQSWQRIHNTDNEPIEA